MSDRMNINNFDEAFEHVLNFSYEELSQEPIDSFVSDAFSAFESMDEALSRVESRKFLCNVSMTTLSITSQLDDCKCYEDWHFLANKVVFLNTRKVEWRTQSNAETPCTHEEFGVSECLLAA